MNERIIEINYTNHAGEQRVRKVQPTGQLIFSSTQWHPDNQWLFTAIDVETPEGEVKQFALSGLSNIAPVRDDEDVTVLEAKIETLTSELTAADATIVDLTSKLDTALDQIKALNTPAEPPVPDQVLDSEAV